MIGLALNGGAPPPRPPSPLGGTHTAVEALRASALYCVGIGKPVGRPTQHKGGGKVRDGSGAIST